MGDITGNTFGKMAGCAVRSTFRPAILRRDSAGISGFISLFPDPVSAGTEFVAPLAGVPLRVFVRGLLVHACSLERFLIEVFSSGGSERDLPWKGTGFGGSGAVSEQGLQQMTRAISPPHSMPPRMSTG